MRSPKRIAQFFLAIIAFSFIMSALPAFAETDPYKLGYDQNDIAGSLPTKISAFVKGGDQYDAYTDGYDLQKDEKEKLSDFTNYDLCDRTEADNGLGHPTFLGMLFKLVGDSDTTDIDEATISYENSQIKPEMVPKTDYDCFPSGWREKYSAAAWHNYQRAHGTYQCGRFDVTCAIEQALRNWISDAIQTGLTWIMNIATGSGSGGNFQACRVGANQDVDIDNPDYINDQNGTVDRNIDAGFTHEQMANCDAALNTYYALDKVETPKGDSRDGQLVAIGLKGEPTGSDGKFDRPPEIGSGETSINSDATRMFFSKSANIGIILAVGMLVGAVIQAMVQSKPQLLFRAIIIQLPLFGISLLAVPVLTKNFMAFIDGVSYYLADNSQRDIQRVALAIGVHVGDAFANGAETIENNGAAVAGGGAVAAGGAIVAASTTGPLLASLMQGSLIVLMLIGFAFLVQALGLWALMQFREASIVLVIAVIPLSMSASIWPTLTRTANKFIKLLASLIVAKIPIVMALSMGLHFIGEWAKPHLAQVVTTSGTVSTSAAMTNIPQGGNRILIMGMAIFCLAFLAPTFVITLFDAIGEMGGSLASRMHSGAGRSGLMYASQAAGLKGMPGMLTGNKLAKAKAERKATGDPSKADIAAGIKQRKVSDAVNAKMGTPGGGDSSGPSGGESSNTSTESSSSTNSSTNSTGPQGSRPKEGGGAPGPAGPQGARPLDGKDGKDGKDSNNPSNPWSNKSGPTKGGKLS